MIAHLLIAVGLIVWILAALYYAWPIKDSNLYYDDLDYPMANDWQDKAVKQDAKDTWRAIKDSWKKGWSS